MGFGMSFFEAPWHVILLLLAALLLFGSARLPGAAKALGQSMNIFKRSLKEGANEGESAANPQVTQGNVAPPQQLIGRVETPDPQAQAQQSQIDALQRQLDDLKQSSSGASSAEQHDTRSH
jgi:sec-independent protein translocase protein TatA